MLKRSMGVFLAALLAFGGFPAEAMQFSNGPLKKIGAGAGAMPLSGPSASPPAALTNAAAAGGITSLQAGVVSAEGLSALPADPALSAAAGLPVEEGTAVKALIETPQAESLIENRGDPEAAAVVQSEKEFDGLGGVKTPGAATERLYSGVEIELNPFRREFLSGQYQKGRGKLSRDEQKKRWFYSHVPEPGVPRIVRYPGVSGKCSYGHDIEWGFYYSGSVNGKKYSIELGQEEVVKFGLMTETEKAALIIGYKEKAAALRETHPELKVLLQRESLEKLRTRYAQDEWRRRQLRALGSLVDAGALDVMDLYVKEADGAPKRLVTEDDLREFHAALTERRPEAERRPALTKPGARTQLQELLIKIGRAVAAARRGDFSVWDDLTPEYSRLLKYLSAFTIKVAALFQLDDLARNAIGGGRTLGQGSRWAFAAAGPAIGERALIEAGLRAGREVHNLDASRRMLDAGSAAVASEGFSEGHYSHQVDVLKERIPAEDGYFDVVETGLMESVSDPAEAAHFFSEANRVLADRGYLMLTLKHGLPPRAFQEALKFYGFEIARARSKLGYDSDLETSLTRSNGDALTRLRSHLSGGAVLIAVKRRGVSMHASDAERGQALAGLRPWREDRPESPAVERVASGPSLAEPVAFDYSALAAAARERPLPPRVSDPPRVADAPPASDEPPVANATSVVSNDEDVEKTLDDLDLIHELLPGRNRDLGVVRERAAKLLALWRREGIEALSAENLAWLRQVQEWVEKNEFKRTFSDMDLSQIFGSGQAFQISGMMLYLQRNVDGSVGREAPKEVKGPLPLAMVRLALRNLRAGIHPAQIGLSLREAQYLYVPETKSPAPIARTLRGDLLVIAMARPSSHFARKFLSRFSDPKSLWKPAELSMIAQEFPRAWEYLAGQESARSDFWSLPEIALALRLQDKFGRSLQQADVVAAFPGIDKRLGQIPGDPSQEGWDKRQPMDSRWESLMTIVFGEPNHRSGYLRDSGIHRVRGIDSWFDEVFNDLTDFAGMIPPRARAQIGPLIARRDMWKWEPFSFEELDLLRSIRREWISMSRRNYSSLEITRYFPTIFEEESLLNRIPGGRKIFQELQEKWSWWNPVAFRKYFRKRERMLYWRHSLRYAALFSDRGEIGSSLEKDLQTIISSGSSWEKDNAGRLRKAMEDDERLDNGDLRWIYDRSLHYSRRERSRP